MAKADIHKELNHVMTLIQLEKEEELAHYHKAMENQSFVSQRNMGICWYPIKIEKTSFDSGERLLIQLSRMPEHQQGHSFQSGKLVRLFRDNNQIIKEDEFVTAVINYVKDNEMLITLNSDYLPDWTEHGKLGVQLLFDENVYKEMNGALQYLLETKEEDSNRLKNVLLGTIPAVFEQKRPVYSQILNEKQNEVLNKVLCAKDVAIIHGPPGTGKTTTLVEAIVKTLDSEKQVLVVAQSNAAVDLLVEKLSAKAIDVVRVGHPARLTELVLQNSLDSRFAKHETYKELRAVRRQADEYQRMAKKYKRNFGENEREQRRLLFSESRKLKKEAKQLAFYIRSDLLTRAQVIACTMIGAANSVLKGIKFNTVFIDEASQALEAASWIPIIKAKRVIFAGDHQQLPPTIKSVKAAKDGLQKTLFEKALERNNVDIMLNIQYRMHEIIMGFSSQQFYNNELKAHESVAEHLIFEGDLPFEFVDTAGTGFFEQVDEETKSTYNVEEAQLLATHLKAYIESVEASGEIRNLESIGIISPYRAQIKKLKKVIFEAEAFPEFIQSIININTVDSFQGQERDVIYISMVRSNEKNQIGFLNDIRRMNVAMTRARKKLVIFGDSATLSKHQFYNNFLDYVATRANYRSAFEWIND